jgi:hypothetical protein
VVQVVPFSCPLVSTIATAMGRSKATQQWLQPEDPSTSKISEPGERRRRELLEKLESELTAKNVKAAEEAFFEWVASEESKLDSQDSASITFAKAPYGRGKAPAAPKLRPKKESKIAILPYHFMTKLLNILLLPNMLTSPKILGYLLERQLVSQNMVEGGVTKRLEEIDDWVSSILIMICTSLS